LRISLNVDALSPSSSIVLEYLIEVLFTDVVYFWQFKVVLIVVKLFSKASLFKSTFSYALSNNACTSAFTHLLC